MVSDHIYLYYLLYKVALVAYAGQKFVSELEGGLSKVVLENID